jgi:hypothetical protein
MSDKDLAAAKRAGITSTDWNAYKLISMEDEYHTNKMQTEPDEYAERMLSPQDQANYFEMRQRRPELDGSDILSAIFRMRMREQRTAPINLPPMEVP